MCCYYFDLLYYKCIFHKLRSDSNKNNQTTNVKEYPCKSNNASTAKPNEDNIKQSVDIESVLELCDRFKFPDNAYMERSYIKIVTLLFTFSTKFGCCCFLG